MVTITDALIGVVSSSPFKNRSILMTTPKIAAIKNLKKSLFSIFSCGKKKLQAQNNTVAPATRKITRAKGGTK